MGKIKIAPSILAADAAKLGQEVKMVEGFGADMLHIDIMDGNFVPNLSFGPGVVESLRKISNIEFDVHLMIKKPIEYIEAFAKAGADIITVHQESDSDINECIKIIHSFGKKAGIVINPDTPAQDCMKYLKDTEMTLIMSVYPGFGGQKFMPEVLDKVAEIRAAAGNDYDIEIDGGINTENCTKAIKAGVNILVAGSSIFGAEDAKKAIDKMRNCGIC